MQGDTHTISQPWRLETHSNSYTEETNGTFLSDSEKYTHNLPTMKIRNTQQ